MTTMERLLKHPRVEFVDDERDCGNGVIVTLRQGWTFDPMCDNRVVGENTVSEALARVRMSLPFAGPYTP